MGNQVKLSYGERYQGCGNLEWGEGAGRVLLHLGAASVCEKRLTGDMYVHIIWVPQASVKHAYKSNSLCIYTQNPSISTYNERECPTYDGQT